MMLSKNFDIQGVIVFQAQRHTYKYVEGLKNNHNAVDRIFLRRIRIYPFTEKLEL